MSDATPSRAATSDPRQVTLAGDPSPFEVTDDDSLAPLRVGALGPPVLFDVPVEVAEPVVPRRVKVPPLMRFSDPNLKAVNVEDMLYAGRVEGASLEATVFSFGTEGGPQVGIYFWDRDLIIAVASTPPGRAPGTGRTTVGPPEGNADLAYFGPLDPDVAVVVLEAEERPIAAVRPRARFAVFDALNLGFPFGSGLRFVAHGSTGNVIHEVMIEPLRGRPQDAGTGASEREAEDPRSADSGEEGV